MDPVENSLVYYIALKNAGVPVEMHLYEANRGTVEDANTVRAGTKLIIPD